MGATLKKESIRSDKIFDVDKLYQQQFFKTFLSVDFSYPVIRMKYDE